MTGKERICSLVNNEKPERVPIFPKIAYASTLAARNISIGDFMINPVAMAEAIITAQQMFGWDGVGLTTDISINGMILGSEYEWHENAPYSIKKYLLDDIGEIERIKLKNPWGVSGGKVVLKAVEIVKEEIGQEAFIQAWTNGPLNVASQLINLDEILVAMITEPEKLHALLNICTEASVIYAKELIKTGADAINFGHAVASSSVISKDMYQEFALPYEKKIIEAIHSMGAIAMTHICGKIEPILDLVIENGSDIIDFDHDNDFNRLTQIVNRPVVFRGNIDPELLSNGTPEQVYEKVKELILTAQNKSQLILGTGCEVQSNTPIENLKAFMDAGREFGSKLL
jgi:MtaA/CmuA family methyltransferase